jgi:hypothetical protein
MRQWDRSSGVLRYQDDGVCERLIRPAFLKNFSSGCALQAWLSKPYANPDFAPEAAVSYQGFKFLLTDQTA